MASAASGKRPLGGDEDDEHGDAHADADATADAGDDMGAGASSAALAAGTGMPAVPPPTSALVKRARLGGDNDGAIVQVIQNQRILRTSSLLAPTMLLTGHEGPVNACKFSPDGASLASASTDRTIMLWRTSGDCFNYDVLKGHGNAVLDVDWSWDGSLLFSASTDKYAAAWDASTGQRVKKLRGHTAVVNSISASTRGPHLAVSGSDDTTVRLHDLRLRDPVTRLKHAFPITAVCMGTTGNEVYAGGLDNTIYVWDLRREAVGLTLAGHADTITSLRLSPEGWHILSNSMDNTLRIWDIKPFAHGNRCLRSFEGAPHGIEQNLLACAWSKDSRYVAAGSGDRTVVVWDAETTRILYKLPGHKGSVNGVDFHPKEPVVASASTDKQIFLGELAAR